jgi:hypothetical protein
MPFLTTYSPLWNPRRNWELKPRATYIASVATEGRGMSGSLQLGPGNQKVKQRDQQQQHPPKRWQ